MCIWLALHKANAYSGYGRGQNPLGGDSGKYQKNNIHQGAYSGYGRGKSPLRRDSGKYQKNNICQNAYSGYGRGKNPLRGDSGKYQKNRYSPGCGFDDRKHTNINTYKDIEVDLWNCTTKGFSSSLNSSENRNSYTADGF